MEAVSTSETPVCFCETTERSMPEGCHVHTRRRKNLKSQFRLSSLAKTNYCEADRFSTLGFTMHSFCRVHNIILHSAFCIYE
jgi:hypothetical protein